MQGKGKFEIEFEGKMRKKEKPCIQQSFYLNIWCEHSHDFKSRECRV